MVDTKKLRKMARFIERNVPAKNFDLSVTYECKARTPKGITKALKNHTCGTVGCVMGYAPIVFPDKVKYDYPYASAAFVELMSKTSGVAGFNLVAQELFDLEWIDAHDLFTGDRTKSEQVKHMRDFCTRVEKQEKYKDTWRGS